MVKNPLANAGDTGDKRLIPRSGRPFGGRNGSILASSVFLPGESQGQRKLVGYSPWLLSRTRLKQLNMHA